MEHFFFNKKNDVLIFGQSFVTNLVVAKNYNFTQYRYTRCEFWQIYRQITFSSYILYVCKIFRKLKVNNYVIN